MKVAIIYRGEYVRLGNKETSFFKCIDNHKKYLYPHFPDHDLFFQTKSFNEEQDNKLLNSLNFTKYNFINADVNKNTLDSIINSLKIYDFHKYDFIVNVRFDLVFFQPLCNFRINYTKFNFLWVEPKKFEHNGMKRVCDHLIMFNSKFLENFKKINFNDPSINITRKNAPYPANANRGHHINQYLYLSECEMNFMIDGEHYCGCSDAHRDRVARTYVSLERRINL